MSDSSSRFLVGFTKALERSKRTKQQTVQKVTADAVAIDVVTSNAIITTPQDHDELYRTTIIQNMITLIKQRKMK